GTLFFLDAIEEMIDVYFNVANRHDVEVTFVEPRSRAAYFELLRAPGVLRGEPYRAVSVRLRNGYLEERIGLLGVPLDADLSRMIDTASRPVVPPPGGLVLSSDVADELRIAAGDVLTIEVTEGRRPELEVPVAAVSTTFLRPGARMRPGGLHAPPTAGAVIAGAYLPVGAGR